MVDIFLVLFGIGIIIFGMEPSKLFDGLFDPEKDEGQFIKLKFGFKIAGYTILIIGIIKVISNLRS